MLCYTVLSLVKNTLHMNSIFFFTAFLLQLLISDGSPTSKATGSVNGDDCPRGWLHYEHFCVSRGKGRTDREVALYCDGYGGIGITGLCITRAPHSYTSLGQTVERPESPMDLSDQRSDDPLSASQLSALGHRLGSEVNADTLSSQQAQAQGLDLLEEEKSIEELGCAPGWIHYRHICVYKPMSIKERCHTMDAVEFNGLCLKRADTQEIARRGTGTLSRTEKRVCCCSHINAQSNGYGCF